MIKLKSVKLKDGTVYKNLYYSNDWEDLEYCMEDRELKELLFHTKKAGAYKDLSIKSEDIEDILLDETYRETDVYVNEEGALVTDAASDLEKFLSDKGLHCVGTFSLPLGSEAEQEDARKCADITDAYEQIEVITEDIVRDTFEDLKLKEFSQEQVDTVKAAIMALCENEMLYRKELTGETVMTNAVKITMMVIMFLLDRIGEQNDTGLLDMDRTSFLLEFASYIGTDSKIGLYGNKNKKE